ncbi:MAG: polysaccharide biosynthesis tyrosine autokinase [Vicinamibacterales bacterium]
MSKNRRNRRPPPLPPSRPVSAFHQDHHAATPTTPEYGDRGAEVDPNWIASYLRILYRHRLPAALVLATIVLAALVYVFTATPLYEARAQLLIQVETPEVIQFRDSQDREQLTTDDYQTQYAILHSRSLARRTIDSLQLWEHPEFRVEGSSRLGQWLGRDTVPATKDAAPGPEETGSQTRVINNFLAKLSVEPVTNSRLVDVKFRSREPQLASQIANTLARNYIDQNVETRFQAAKAAAEWLEQQLSEQRARLEKGQQNLQRYRESNPGSGADNAQNIVTQKLADLNAAVTRAETQRIEKQAAYERLKGIQSDQEALDSFPAILANPFIQSLKTELASLQRQRQDMAQRLGERHPDMVKLGSAIESAETRLHSEIAKVVQAVENEYLAAQAQEQRLLGELSQQQRAALAQDRKSIDYGVLQREVASNQQLFDSLLQRAKELGIAGEFRTTNVRIVDQAEVPQATVWPAKLQTLLMALLVGSALALVTAFGLERFDSRIKSPAEIPAQLGLPYLGLVPEIPAEALLDGRSPLVNSGAPPSMINAFEDLSANVMIMTNPDAPRVVMVCSAGPSEGKTLVATNLAVAIAELGQRVVLVDVDMRRPRVHEVFEIEKNPGLTDLLAGEAKPSEAVRRSRIPGLWIVPAGQTPENSAAFLGGGPHFKTLLSDFSGRFDWIVIDSPPVLAVADSTLIAQDVAGVVFVVNTKTTGRDAAHVAIDRLDAAGAKFFGAVLNRADIERHGYYFDPYYRKEYGAYYGRPEDATAMPAADGLAALNGEGEEVVVNGSGAAKPKRRRHSGRRIRPPATRAYLAERDNW